MQQISPGSISRTSLAPMMSRPGRLAGEAVAAVELAQHQRTHAVGIAEADDLVLGEQHGAERAAQAGDDVAQGLLDVARGVLGKQSRDDLGVGRALEDMAVLAADPGRSSSVFTRLPLWARAMNEPSRVRAKGWALRISLEPVVE